MVIKPQDGHIALDRTVSGIANWANAIFVSPSVFYASHYVYSERVLDRDFSSDEAPASWCTLVQCLVRPASYRSFPHTLFRREENVAGEPEDVEFRVDDKGPEMIFRVTDDGAPKSLGNCEVVALVFVREDFLASNPDFETVTEILSPFNL